MFAQFARRFHRIGGGVAILIFSLSLAACGGRPEPTPTPTPLPTATPTPTPAPTPTPKPAVTERGAVGAATAGGVEIVTTEQQLNEMLQTALATQQDLPLSDLLVRLDPGQIIGTGRLAFGFINANVQLSLGLSAVDGKVIPTNIEILLDGKPVPALLQSQVDAMTAPLVEEASRADYGFYVESVEITDDAIRISGKP